MKSDQSITQNDAKSGHTVRHAVVLSLAVVLVMGTLTFAEISHLSNPIHHASLPRTSYPMGVKSAGEPSGYAPPGETALRGYSRTYVNDFNSPGTPSGWSAFSGVPGGAPGGRFNPKHVTVKNGMLLLTTYRDKNFNNHWVTGGLCQCGLPYLYGAFFVRSRFNGLGPNEVELLWPEDNQWPPEIDFNETTLSDETIATLHWGFANYTQQITKTNVNMMAWHTWGIIWTPKEIVYVLDGRVWGVITSKEEIPTIPMRLDLEQRTRCLVHSQCPKAPVQMQIDWVVEYRSDGTLWS